MGICQLMDEHFEADDLCGSMAKKFESQLPVKILTKDNDYLQLVTDNTTLWLMHSSAEKTQEIFDKYHMKKEDMAIHKSVASFVDKEYRENAKASNCYTRKSGKFLPQYNSVMQPEFRKEYKDKISYFEMTDDFCTSDIMLRRYIDHILKKYDGKK